MLRGLYESAGALKALQQAQTLVADNIANDKTPGYRAERPVFASYLPLALTESPSGQVVGPYALGVDSTAIARSPAPPTLTVTGQALDVAPAPTTWIAVRTRHGVQYTQNGQLAVNAAGILTTVAGDVVESVSGRPIAAGPAAGIAIRPDGMVTQSGKPVGHMRLVTIGLGQRMTSTGPDRWVPAKGAAVAAGGRLTPGALLGSNVNLANQAAWLIQIAAGFQANAETANTQVTTFTDLLQNGLVP